MTLMNLSRYAIPAGEIPLLKMWRTRIDLPQFTRCCFCIPLRYGILSWAYLKVGALTLSALANTAELIYLRSMSVTKVFIILMCIVLYLDILCTILCIIAGHMKHRRGLKIYFYFSLGILITFVSISLTYTVSSIVRYFRYIQYQWIVAVQEVFITLLALFVQTYILLLVRSEVLKLSDPPNLRFVNHDVEQAHKSDTNAILREEQEDTESRMEEVAYAYTY